MTDTTADPDIFILDHTADMGFEVHGKTLQSIFEKSALALTTILTNPYAVSLSEEVAVEIDGSDMDSLMYNWLSELLYLFDGEKKLFGDFGITSFHADNGNFRISARLKGETYDYDKHEIRTYVKAITFHQMEIHNTEPSCWARVFIDI